MVKIGIRLLHSFTHPLILTTYVALLLIGGNSLNKQQTSVFLISAPSSCPLLPPVLLGFVPSCPLYFKEYHHLELAIEKYIVGCIYFCHYPLIIPHLATWAEKVKFLCSLWKRSVALKSSFLISHCHNLNAGILILLQDLKNLLSISTCHCW